jgi:hypothetical protein
MGSRWVEVVEEGDGILFILVNKCLVFVMLEA